MEIDNYSFPISPDHNGEVEIVIGFIEIEGCEAIIF